MDSYDSLFGIPRDPYKFLGVPYKSLGIPRDAYYSLFGIPRDSIKGMLGTLGIPRGSKEGSLRRDP